MGISLEDLISYQLSTDDTPTMDIPKVEPKFFESAWYREIIFYLQNLQCPNHMERLQVRSMKLKAIKYYILDEKLY